MKNKVLKFSSKVKVKQSVETIFVIKKMFILIDNNINKIMCHDD